MRGFLSFILLATTISGCAKQNTSDGPSISAGIYINPSARYLALGDSYTVAQSLQLEQSFPYQLSGQLSDLKIGNPSIIAATGWTTTDLIAAIDQSGVIGQKYDFVTLLIGVNDQYQGKSIDSYSANFEKLLKTAIQLANNDPKRVFVVSIPDYSVTPFASGGNRDAIAAEIDQFNSKNKQISSNNNVNYVDITDISRRAKSEPDLLAGDGLHPSAKMYGLWVQRLQPLVRMGLAK